MKYKDKIKQKELEKNLLTCKTRKEAMLKSGYGKAYSNTGNILKTKRYQNIIGSIVEQLDQERQRVLTEMINKKLGKEKYKDLVDVIDKLTKNIQLLSGGATEKIINIDDEQVRRIVLRESDRIKRGSN